MTIKSDRVTTDPASRTETESLLSSNPTASQDEGYYISNELPFPATTSHSHSLLIPGHSPTSISKEEIALADKRARRRILSAYFYALLIYIGMGLWTGTIVLDETKWRRHRHHVISHVEGRVCKDFSEPLTSSAPSTLSQISFSHPILALVSAFSPSQVAQTTYPLTLKAHDTLWFQTEGNSVGGQLEIVIMSSDDEREEGRVEVSVESYGMGNTDGLLVCMEDKKREDSKGYKRGIDIFAPTSRHLPNLSEFKIHVTYYIPASLTFIDSLITNSSNFAFVSHSEEFPSFNDISLKHSNYPITINGPLLASKSILLETSNARIGLRGLVEAPSVVLITRNAPIESGEIRSTIDTSISNMNGPITGYYTISHQLIMRTTNAKVDAKISLVLPRSDSVQKEDPRFYVDITSTNQRVDVLYLDQPRETHLDSTVSTWNAPVQVSHYPQYEGSYSLSTSNAPISVSGPKTTSDPSGLSRIRILFRNTVTKHLVSGSIGWEVIKTIGDGGKGAEMRGTSVVKSSNGKVEMIFL